MRNQGFAEAQLDGLNLRIVTVPQAPFVYYDASKTGNDAYTGYYIDFWNLLALRLSQNFTWAFYNSPDGKFGGLSPDGNWTGMIKEILDGNADLAVADFTITSVRYEPAIAAPSHLQVQGHCVDRGLREHRSGGDGTGQQVARENLQVPRPILAGPVGRTLGAVRCRVSLHVGVRSPLALRVEQAGQEEGSHESE